MITAIDEIAYIHPADSSDKARKVITRSRAVVIALLTFIGIPIVVWRVYAVVKRTRQAHPLATASAEPGVSMSEPSGIRLHEFVAWLRATAAERAKTSPTSGVDLDYAADLIERTIPIPVTERPPKKDSSVLAFTPKEGWIVMYFGWDGFRTNDAQWDNYRIRNADVTHWLPRPPNPE